MELRTFDEINKIAEKIGEEIKKGNIKIVALIGDLGTGKTHFTKILAKKMGFFENIKSPTFNYVNTYENKDFIFSHFDVYRLDSQDELFEIGFEDYLDGRILVIEWADKIPDLLPKDTIYIKFKHYDENKRYIEVVDRRFDD